MSGITRNWYTQPINRCCEVRGTEVCGKPTEFAYQALGLGWMALCKEHAVPHECYAYPIADLLLRGERMR